jgi:uncharacterized membrane protein YfcA
MSNLDAKDYLLIALAAVGLIYLVVLVRGLTRDASSPPAPDATVKPTAAGVVTGFITNFFDTLGIGSFATSTAIFRQWKMLRDEWIPGTLNVGHTLPTFLQAFIFTKIVPVETRTLILMIAAAICGAWLGAGFVARWPRRRIQIGMGSALLVAAVLMLMTATGLMPVPGDAIGLSGTKLVVAVAVNFGLGALMTLGIGLYAPCMILIYMMGMNPTAAFPIMMGSCAFLMPVASARFIKERSYHPGVSLSLLIGGIPAVYLASQFFESLPIAAVRYLVVIVVLYTAINLLRTAMRERNQATIVKGGTPEGAPL